MAHEVVIKPVLYPGVTVSSTFSDLEKHRQALLAAIGQGAHDPAKAEPLPFEDLLVDYIARLRTEAADRAAYGSDEAD